MREGIRFKPIVQQAIRRFSVVPHILRYFNPHYSYCRKCGLPWNWCSEKVVKISESSGIFATCDVCWDNCTLEELKEYYSSIYVEHRRCSIEYNTNLNYTLRHLLKCVEDEYIRTHRHTMIKRDK